MIHESCTRMHVYVYLCMTSKFHITNEKPVFKLMCSIILMFDKNLLAWIQRKIRVPCVSLWHTGCSLHMHNNSLHLCKPSNRCIVIANMVYYQLGNISTYGDDLSCHCQHALASLVSFTYISTWYLVTLNDLWWHDKKNLVKNVTGKYWHAAWRPKEKNYSYQPHQKTQDQDAPHGTNPRRCSTGSSLLAPQDLDLDKVPRICNTYLWSYGCINSRHFQHLCSGKACRIQLQILNFHNHT